LTRSVGLAEAFIDAGSTCSFIGHYDAAALMILRLAGIPWDVVQTGSWGSDDAELIARLGAQRGASGIVVDSYLVSPEYLERVGRGGVPLLLIDDLAALRHYPCSAVLNFTTRATALPYPPGPAQYLLGPRWFLPRRALRQARAGGYRPIDDVGTVLVAAGGSDPHDIAIPLVEALLACDRSLSVHCVIGGNYGARPLLDALLARFDGGGAVLTHLPDLAQELSWADLCLSSAGLTKYEAAYIGTPAGVLSQNDGQAMDVVEMEALGAVIDLGSAAHVEQDRLARQVNALIRDRALRQSLREGGAALFPPDPAADAASALLSGIFQRFA
jgi:spore coat polysaccharide biosynthesis predicted glycosyltransferase SpsG